MSDVSRTSARSGASRRRPAGRRARRRRRPSRSCRTCRRSPSTIDGQRQKPELPLARAARARRRACRRATTKSPPSSLRRRRSRTPRTAAARPAAAGRRVPRRGSSVTFIECAAVRSKRASLVVVGALVALLVPAATALAGNGGFAPVAPESPNAEGIQPELPLHLDLRVRDLRPRRGPADRVHRSATAAGTRPRFEDGAQIHGATEARARVDGRPGRRSSFVDRARSSSSSCRGSRTSRAASAASEQLVDRRRPAASSTGSTSTRTASSRSTACARRSGVPVRARGHGARLRTSSTRGGSRRSAARSTRSRAGSTRPGSRRRTPGVYTGPVRRALRPRAREDARVGRGACRAAEFDAWLDAARERADAGHVDARRGDVGRASARSATASHGEGGIGPRIAGSPTLAAIPQALETLVRNGRAHRCPPVGSGWTDEQVDALDRLPEGEPRRSGG